MRIDGSSAIEAFISQFVLYRIVLGANGAISIAAGEATRSTNMNQYAGRERTINDAIGGGGLLVVAQWEAKDGQADKVAGILARFLPEAQSEPGAKLFLISRAKDNPAQFLFYELFRDEAAFKAHQDSAHFKAYIAEQALPLLARRERSQYALL
jgi:quinol monooxygenase YgiN